MMAETFPRNIEIEEVSTSGLWLVRADITHVHQLLLNLCVNARDAMPEGGRMVLRASNVMSDGTASAAPPAAKAGPFVRIEVEDEGVGISPEDQAHVFEDFFTTKGPASGTGLGLPTVKRIAERYGGWVDFRSLEGAGTTFVVHLPAIAESTPGASAIAPPKTPRGQGEVVLVVDDECAILRATQLSLQRAGYKTLLARNGTDALALLESNLGTVRVILADLMMPHMGGLEFCRAARTLAPDLPILISKGDLFEVQSSKTEEILRQMKADGILQKPHTAEALLEAIARFLPPPMNTP